MASDDDITTTTTTPPSPLHRVVVLGAKGRTGRLVIKHLKEAGAEQVVAVARSVEGEENDDVIKWEQGDVKNPAKLEQLFQDTSAVVFAASASQGWSLRGDNTPKHVDYEGCVLVAKAAVGAKVPKLAIISSAFVARPFHPIALMLSILFGRVMQWKRKGELETIALTQAPSSSTSYIIIRPGGLSDKKAPLGMQGIKISQGDRVGGIITRDDTALVTVQALLNEQAKNTVFELVSYKDTHTSTGKETDNETDTDTHTPTIPHRFDDWTAFFSKLRQNDGSHDPSFYPVDELEGKGLSGGGGKGDGEGGEPTTAKTDL